MRLIDGDSIKWHRTTECGGHGIFFSVDKVYKKEIDKMPTIDPESQRPHGRWINIHDGNFICSCCKNPVNIVDMMSHPLMIGYLYCPYCGAKMEGGHNP